MTTIRRLRTSLLALFVVLLAAPALAQSPAAATKPPPPGPGKTPLGANVRYLLELERTTGALTGFEWKPTALSVGEKTNRPQQGFVMHAGSGAPSAFYRWLEGSLDNTARPLDGVVFASVPAMGTFEALEFSGGRLTEIVFPAVDVASRDAVQQAVHVDAGAMQRTPGGAAKLPQAPSGARWPASKFRVTMGKIDPKDIVHVDAFAVRPNQVARLKLKILARGTAVSQALEEGRRAPQPLRLDWLAGDGKTVLATLELRNARMVSLVAPSLASASKAGAQFTVEVEDRPKLSFASTLGH